MTVWITLILAIIAEVLGTIFLKASEGFSLLLPSLATIFFYSIAFYFLSIALKILPVGIAYAIWSGLGIVLVSISAAIIYKQIPNIATIIGMALIITGIAIMQLFSQSTH
jgi:small multidrug resistance pump